MREIHIKPVLNGFIVNVGCQTIVIEGKAHLVAELARYVYSPAHTEKEYLGKAISTNGPSNDHRVLPGNQLSQGEAVVHNCGQAKRSQ